MSITLILPPKPTRRETPSIEGGHRMQTRSISIYREKCIVPIPVEECATTNHSVSRHVNKEAFHMDDKIIMPSNSYCLTSPLKYYFLSGLETAHVCYVSSVHLARNQKIRKRRLDRLRALLVSGQNKSLLRVFDISTSMLYMLCWAVNVHVLICLQYPQRFSRSAGDFIVMSAAAA